MKNFLLLILAVSALASCDNFPIYYIKINNKQEYTLQTDCGKLHVTSAIVDFGYSRTFRVELAADNLKSKYTIIPEKFRLYVNDKRIILKKAYVKDKKTQFVVEGSAVDSVTSGMKMFLLADSAILCNGQSLISKDTLRFEVVPR